MEHVEYSNHFVVDDHVVIEDDGNDDDVEAVTMVDVKNVVQVRLRHYDVIQDVWSCLFCRPLKPNISC